MKENTSDCVHITFGSMFLNLDLLRWSIRKGHLISSLFFIGLFHSWAKITNFDLSLTVCQNILRLQISMSHSSSIKFSISFKNQFQFLQCLFSRKTILWNYKMSPIHKFTSNHKYIFSFVYWDDLWHINFYNSLWFDQLLTKSLPSAHMENLWVNRNLQSFWISMTFMATSGCYWCTLYPLNTLPKPPFPKKF